jgi:hypothetical protein
VRAEPFGLRRQSHRHIPVCIESRCDAIHDRRVDGVVCPLVRCLWRCTWPACRPGRTADTDADWNCRCDGRAAVAAALSGLARALCDGPAPRLDLSFLFHYRAGNRGGIGGSENRARNFALVGMGFSAAGFIGPFAAASQSITLATSRRFSYLRCFQAFRCWCCCSSPTFCQKHASMQR